MSWFNEKTPDAAKAFSELRNSVYKEGALDLRTKELISIAASTVPVLRKLQHLINS